MKLIQKTIAVVLAVLSLSGILASGATAQDPVSGALATLAAATVQAARWREAQAAARATDTAWQAQMEATRTAAAAQAQATVQAVEAAGAVMAAQATAQALQAQATQSAGQAQAQATAQAIQAGVQAQAAAAAQEALAAEQAERERYRRLATVAEVWLYAFLALGLAAGGLLAWRAVRALEQRATEEQDVMAGPDAPYPYHTVVDGCVAPTNRRGLVVAIIDDPDDVERLDRFIQEVGL